MNKQQVKIPDFLESSEYARVRFAGDSGDGMQLTGSQFASSTTLSGNDFATFPDFPAEIRAPVGTVYGVSSYSINFGSCEVYTSGDNADVLVAMNPAGLKTQINDLKTGGLIIVDESSFTNRNLEKAGYKESPLEDNTLAQYQIFKVDMSKLTLEAVKPFGLSNKDSLRCKNMWALGFVSWLFQRDRQPIHDWLTKKFKKIPDIANANKAALNAGHIYGETAEVGNIINSQNIAASKLAPGKYRTITGIDAAALGLLAAAKLSNLTLFLGSYPITPATGLLHFLSHHKDTAITFQAEDEIAAIGAAIGASYSGSLAVTTSSGPGIALKTEAIGLAISTELPLLIINVQRGGPSTGLPTKTEQSDLFQAVYGRNGDAPLPVIAASNAGDSFDCTILAARIALEYMTPVILLLDGYIANAAEPWKLPKIEGYPEIEVSFRTETDNFHPYVRNPKTLSRAWAIPGTPGLEHRIGGLEKDYNSGNISYDSDNHDLMTRTRRDKILGVQEIIPPQEVLTGEDEGDLVIIGWGSSYGPITMAVKRARARGVKVSHIHMRHIWPLPSNLADLLSGFNKVIVAELNTGQLQTLLKAELLLDVKGYNKVSGKPFRIADLLEMILNEANLVNENE